MNKKIVFRILIGAGIILLPGFVLKTSYDPPPNAIVYIYPKEKKYYSYPTVEFHKELVKKYETKQQNLKDVSLDEEIWEALILPDLVETNLKYAQTKGYIPDPDSEKNGDFKSEPHSLIIHFMEQIGLLRKSDRWNDDGTWKY